MPSTRQELNARLKEGKFFGDMKIKRRVLVTGADGAVASSVVPHLFKEGHIVLPTDICQSPGNTFEIRRMDVRNIEEVRRQFKEFGPELVIHLAAEIDLERCQKDPGHAYKTNAEGTKNVATACKENSAVLVYSSSVGVFDGRKSLPYNESDIPNPVNVYGQTKYEGEKYVQAILDQFYIVRFGWMIGGGKKDKKFVSKIIKLIRQGVKELNVVTDKKGTLTYTKHLAEILAKLTGTGGFGTYHIASFGEATRFEVAEEMAKLLKRDDIKIKPVTSADIQDLFYAPRPDSESVDSAKINRLVPGILKPWQETLKEYFKDSEGFSDLWVNPNLRS